MCSCMCVCVCNIVASLVYVSVCVYACVCMIMHASVMLCSYYYIIAVRSVQELMVRFEPQDRLNMPPQQLLQIPELAELYGQ